MITEKTSTPRGSKRFFPVGYWIRKRCRSRGQIHEPQGDTCGYRLWGPTRVFVSLAPAATAVNQMIAVESRSKALQQS